MTNPICKFCGEESVTYSFTPYENPHFKGSFNDPHYLFHIALQCINEKCKKWGGWVTQTPDLMESLKGAYLITQKQIDGANNKEKETE